MSSDNHNDVIEELNDDFMVISKTSSDIINGMYFETEEDKLLCESIIDNLEKSISEGLKEEKIVQLPFLGCLRKSPLKKEVRKNYTNFKIARKYMSKEDYKAHVKAVVNDAKEKIAKDDFLKLRIKRIKSKNKKKYESLYLKVGKAYAEMFIFALLNLKEVPFNQEIQDAFDNLKD